MIHWLLCTSTPQGGVMNTNSSKLMFISIVSNYPILIAPACIVTRELRTFSLLPHGDGVPLTFRALSSTMLRKMAIASALRGFNDFGHSVIPKFLSRNRFCLQWSAQLNIVQKWTKTESVNLEKNKHFCPRDIESCHLSTARCVNLWSLNSNLLFKKPHQLTRFH